jgi:hypothetical protein
MMDQQKRNEQRARTSFSHAQESWYSLDNAAIVMPALASRYFTGMFRLSVTLDHPVRVKELTTALEHCARRFPYFMVELGKGFFWHLLQPVTLLPRPEADSRSPCVDFDFRQRNRPIFRVRLAGNRVACEFSHILTDGSGGMVFLKTLTAEYFRLCGIESSPDPQIFNLDEPANPQEFEDAYQRFYRPGMPLPDRMPGAFHFDSPLLPNFQYRVTTGIVSFSALSDIAKSKSASITEFLIALYLQTFLDIRASYSMLKKRRTRPVVAIQVPVNLRKFFSTKTLRNFTLFVLPAVDSRLGTYTLDELVAYTHHFMRMENDGRRIAKTIGRNAGSVHGLAVRLVPRIIKDIAVRILHDRLGENLMTGFLSNLGHISMPPELAPHITRFDFIGPPYKKMKSHICMLYWQDNVYIGFASTAVHRDVEREFFRKMSKLGLHVQVECNMEA